ncbi:unnamed protein product, partial [marine sediment metagenome]
MSKKIKITIIIVAVVLAAAAAAFLLFGGKDQLPKIVEDILINVEDQTLVKGPAVGEHGNDQDDPFSALAVGPSDPETVFLG